MCGKRYFVITAAVFCLSVLGYQAPATAQFGCPKHEYTRPIQTIYAELLGNGIVYSLDYDVVFGNNLGVRFGASTAAFLDDGNNNNNNLDDDWRKYFTILIMGNYYVGRGANRLELGMGFVTGEIEKGIRIQPPALTMTIAYRLLPVEDKKYTFKIGVTPFISHGTLYPSFGIAFGYRIGN